MSSVSDYKVRDGEGKKRNFRELNTCVLNAICSECCPVRKTFKHMFNLNNVVKHYF